MRDAERAFLSFAISRGVEEIPANADDLVAVMGGFYEAMRPGRVSREDGDGLLWQWGPSRGGQDSELMIDLTRQFVRPGRDGTMYQLALTAYFANSAGMAGLGAGNKWCFDPSNAARFQRQIRDSPPFIAAMAMTPARVALEFDRV